MAGRFITECSPDEYKDLVGVDVVTCCRGKNPQKFVLSDVKVTGLLLLYLCTLLKKHFICSLASRWISKWMF